MWPPCSSGHSRKQDHSCSPHYTCNSFSISTCRLTHIFNPRHGGWSWGLGWFFSARTRKRRNTANEIIRRWRVLTVIDLRAFVSPCIDNLVKIKGRPMLPIRKQRFHDGGCWGLWVEWLGEQIRPCAWNQVVQEIKSMNSHCGACLWNEDWKVLVEQGQLFKATKLGWTSFFYPHPPDHQVLLIG